VSDGAFYGYILLLVISGVLLVFMAAKGLGQSFGMRLFDAVFGAGFLIYAGYLLIGQPETVRLLIYAFIVPIVAIGKAYKARQAQLDAEMPARQPPVRAPEAPASPYTYVAPVLTARVGQPPPASPYGRNVPGQPIGPVATPTGGTPLADAGPTDTMSPDQASPTQAGTE
jgi:hypothetical protein